jgi:hypothetical protein
VITLHRHSYATFNDDTNPVAVHTGGLFRQAGRAELFGTILDPSGLAVSRAKVEAEDQATTNEYIYDSISVLQTGAGAGGFTIR